jgi:hypothetical protein
LFGLTALLVIPLFAAQGAQSVTLMWDPNQETNVTGYRLLYGTKSGEYSWQLNVATNAAVANDLLEGETYYFAAVAYTAAGFESDLSAELTYTVPPSPTSPTPSPSATPTGGLVNVSTRMHVGGGEEVLIAGFIVTGQTPTEVVVRGLGPSLKNAGITNAAADPVLTLVDSTGAKIAFNDDWDARNPAAIASGLAPSNSAESLLITTLPAGAYTAVLETKGQPSVALLELYQFSANPGSGVVNISARGRIGSGDDVMIAGFILTGNQPTRVVVRALGPSLSRLGIAQPLSNPELALHDGNGSLIFRNDDWRSEQASQLLSLGMAPSSEEESAIVATLPAGNYSAVVQGVNGSEGVGVVEIYSVE